MAAAIVPLRGRLRSPGGCGHWQRVGHTLKQGEGGEVELKWATFKGLRAVVRAVVVGEASPLTETFIFSGLVFILALVHPMQHPW